MNKYLEKIASLLKGKKLVHKDWLRFPHPDPNKTGHDYKISNFGLFKSDDVDKVNSELSKQLAAAKKTRLDTKSHRVTPKPQKFRLTIGKATGFARYKPGRGVISRNSMRIYEDD